jgi:molecular chaperone HscC
MMAMAGCNAGLFSPIIERNTAVPVSRACTIPTLADNQKKIELGIFQGEAREVSRNIKLGELTIPCPAPGRRDQRQRALQL